MRKTRGGWGETFFPAATALFPKSRASYFRSARFITSESLAQAKKGSTVKPLSSGQLWGLP